MPLVHVEIGFNRDPSPNELTALADYFGDIRVENTGDQKNTDLPSWVFCSMTLADTWDKSDVTSAVAQVIGMSDWWVHQTWTDD